MDISTLTPDKALEAVTAMETVEDLRIAATSINVKYSGNTGEGTLRKKLMDVLSSDLNDATPPEPEEDAVEDFPEVLEDLPKVPEPDAASLLDQDGDEDEIIQKAPILVKVVGPTIAELLKMDPNEIDDQQLVRQVVRARAMRLRRVRITNLDPGDSQLPGAIITALNKFTGKVSRFISFGDENEAGTHVEQILLNHLKQQKFALRKEIKGGQFGVKRYETRMIAKYAIEELPQLTAEELSELASHQRASHAIDS